MYFTTIKKVNLRLGARASSEFLSSLFTFPSALGIVAALCIYYFFLIKFTILTILRNHYHDLVPELFIAPRDNPVPIKHVFIYIFMILLLWGESAVVTEACCLLLW